MTSTTTASSRFLHAFNKPRVLLLLWIIFTLNAVLRLSSGNYHAFGYWFALSLAIGLSWLARKYQRPALGYFAAGGIAMAIFMLGVEAGRNWTARPTPADGADAAVLK
jgi:hypothetical protein